MGTAADLQVPPFHGVAAEGIQASLASDASFRDPCGFVFERDGRILRQVNQGYRTNYDLLMQNGLYDELVEAGLLVCHRECGLADAASPAAYKVLEPEPIRFISYPYEWCFSQLKDAALATLAIQKRALRRGQVLRDASAYNIQFRRGRPVLIDTLSFESHHVGRPWVGYRQFCQHFLAPLALMSRTDIRLGQLLRVHIDGVPLDLASRLLPWRTRFNFSLAVHIHMHARSQLRFADAGAATPPASQQAGSLTELSNLGPRGVERIVEDLQHAISNLRWQPSGTEWHDYYEANNNYGDDALERKRALVSELVTQTGAKRVWDLGANTGFFSEAIAAKGAEVVAWDIDPACVELCYRRVKDRREENILPLLLDLTNPSPALGWANRERSSITARGTPDCLLALGLIHHLVISNNVPLGRVARFFANLSRWLVIEMVPKSDSQVGKLLTTREDVFADYDFEGFERAFLEVYNLVRYQPISGTKRVLYLLETKASWPTSSRNERSGRRGSAGQV